ncbi:serine/threonine-protein phosphatase 7 long form homolog [Chenopodium quinoa]|uniref:serine/threonine-protein phosphatase 7 long form homolog n=1 Tax=Chenopodium quinoa TaxID=63459 RepID=UPI000B797A02|nr:serine/threonine-protein phosphatase 7 long form homolog [Chenopodium quinoa]
MIWQPYTEAVMDRLPEICRSDMHIWRSRAPLICFDVVEFHLPDRVLRQFGLDQPIPQDVDTDVALHRKDRRGQRNWEIRHSDHVHEWSRREALVVQGYPFTGTSSPAMTEYMAWYRRITRLVITPPSQERPRVITSQLPLTSCLHMHLLICTSSYRELLRPSPTCHQRRLYHLPYRRCRVLHHFVAKPCLGWGSHTLFSSLDRPRLHLLLCTLCRSDHHLIVEAIQHVPSVHRLLLSILS